MSTQEGHVPETRTFDKSDWGEGPWQTEPDRADWVSSGYACMALRGPGGQWCGYVGVPSDHPNYEKSYWEDEGGPDVSVHGGITYANKCVGAICHVPQPGMPDDVWWFGFDCNHGMDYAPETVAKLRRRGMNDLDERLWTQGTYRDLAYVRGETERLAAQLKALA